MKKIEIGNSFRVKWTLKQLGEAFNLVGKSYEIEVSSPYGVIIVNEITAENNVLSFNVPSSQQIYTGIYDVLLKITDDASGNSWNLRQCNAFMLVPCGCCGEVPEIVQLESGITMPANGLNAYELAKAQGKFTGTLDEWLNVVMSTSIPVASSVQALDALGLPDGALAAVLPANDGSNFARHCEYIRLDGKWQRISNELFDVINIADVRQLRTMAAPAGAVMNVYAESDDSVTKWVYYPSSGWQKDKQLGELHAKISALSPKITNAQTTANDAKQAAVYASTDAMNAQSSADGAYEAAINAAAKANLAMKLATDTLTGVKPKIIYKRYDDSDYVVENKQLFSENQAIIKNEDTEEVVFMDCTGLTSFSQFANGYASTGTAKRLKKLGGLTNTEGVTNFDSAFGGNTTIEVVDLSTANLAKCANLNYTWQACSKLATLIWPDSYPALQRVSLAFFGTALQSVIFPKDAVKLSMFGQQTFANMPNITVIDASQSTAVWTHLGELTFNNCQKLKTIDVSNADFVNVTKIYNWQGQGGTSAINLFNGCVSLENFSGFKNFKLNFSLKDCSKLTHQSALNCINGLYDLTEGGHKIDYTPKTLTFNRATFATLTEEEIAIATAKGWNVQGY